MATKQPFPDFYSKVFKNLFFGIAGQGILHA